MVSFHSNDLDEARSMVSRHFYVNFIDMLQPSAKLNAAFNVIQHGVNPLQTLRSRSW